jgi:hypothetical protein
VLKVLYVAGWGRSGTTILDNIIGSYESVFSVGELYYLWRRGLSQGRRCGCGERLTICPLWRDVVRVAYHGQPPETRRTTEIQRQVIRVRDTRRLWRAPLRGDAAAYRDEIARLYHAIAEVTGAQLIVDSSKTPPGAAVLATVPDVEAYLLHMVRDPRAVAYSWTRPKIQPDRAVPRQMTGHSPAASSMSWVTWNLLTEEMARSRYPGRSRQVRYEDFVADPRVTVESILDFCGMPAIGTPFRGQTTVELAPNHTVSGNPGRFRTGAVALRDDDAWRAQQPVRDRMISTAVSLPLLRRYGYRVQGVTRGSGLP